MKRLTKEQFITKANLIHNNKYDYNNAIFSKVSDKIIINCSLHGDFVQRVSTHLNSCGCPKCTIKQKPNSTKEFINKAKLVHGNKYDYSISEYRNKRTSITITCKEHGQFNQIASNHLQGSGCPNCKYSKLANIKINKASDNFINKAIEIHGDKYDYSKIEYTNNHTKVNIICPVHQDFKIAPSAHLLNQGCPKCGNDFKGWTRTKFKNLCEKNDKIAKLYLVELYDENSKERFYKIGITSCSLKDRMKNVPYKYKQEILFTHEDSNMVYDTEHLLHRVLKEYSYTPLIEFCGHTECFQYCTDVLQKFKNYIGN